MARVRLKSLKRPRILVVILTVASALAVGAIAVQISRTGIDIFLVALLVSVVVLVERTVGDWFAELLGPGLATAVLTTCVGAVAWLVFSPGGTAERFLIAARVRGYDSLYYRLPNDSDKEARAATAAESSPTATPSDGSSTPPPSGTAAATSGVSVPRVAGPSVALPSVGAPSLPAAPVAPSSVAATPVAASPDASSPEASSSVVAPPVRAARSAAKAPPVAAAPSPSRQPPEATVSSSKLLDLKSIFGHEDVPTSTMTVRVPAVAVTGEEILIRVNVSSAGRPVVGHSIQITVDGRPLSTVVTGHDGVAESRFSSRIPGRYAIRAALPHVPSMRGSSAGASVTILPSRD